MDFIVKDKEDNEIGPINQETLTRWASEGKVRPDTRVRNILLKVWKTADDFPFLKEALENQPPEEKHGGIASALHLKKEHPVIEEKKTAFEYKHIPDPASAELRVAAFLVDLIPLILIGSICFALGYSEIQKNVVKDAADQIEAVKTKEAVPAKGKLSEDEIRKLPPKDNLDAELPPSPSDNVSKGYKQGSKWADSVSQKKYSCIESDENNAKWIEKSKANSIFYFYFTVFLFFALLYYGITLGTFAQTLGMWFFGIFIARNDKENSEVLHFRAFLFSVFMFIFGILTPLMAALPGKRVALHDILTGVRVYRIAGKPKA